MLKNVAIFVLNLYIKLCLLYFVCRQIRSEGFLFCFVFLQTGFRSGTQLDSYRLYSLVVHTVPSTTDGSHSSLLFWYSSHLHFPICTRFHLEMVRHMGLGTYSYKYFGRTEMSIHPWAEPDPSCRKWTGCIMDSLSQG